MTKRRDAETMTEADRPPEVIVGPSPSQGQMVEICPYINKGPVRQSLYCQWYAEKETDTAPVLVDHAQKMTAKSVVISRPNSMAFIPFFQQKG
jgi:hypothetical protein